MLILIFSLLWFWPTQICLLCPDTVCGYFVLVCCLDSGWRDSRADRCFQLVIVLRNELHLRFQCLNAHGKFLMYCFLIWTRKDGPAIDFTSLPFIRELTQIQWVRKRTVFEFVKVNSTNTIFFIYSFTCEYVVTSLQFQLFHSFLYFSVHCALWTLVIRLPRLHSLLIIICTPLLYTPHISIYDFPRNNSFQPSSTLPCFHVSILVVLFVPGEFQCAWTSWDKWERYEVGTLYTYL